MKSRILLTTLGLAVLTSFFTGCAGYTIGHTKPEEFQGITKIHIPTFTNETLEPRLAAIVTNAVISEFQQDGTYKITTKEEADVALNGRVRRVWRQQQRSANNNILRTRELRVRLQVAYTLENLQTGEEVRRRNAALVDEQGRSFLSGQRIRSQEVYGDTTIFLDPNFQLSEREAMPLAAEDAAQQIVAGMTDGW